MHCTHSTHVCVAMIGARAAHPSIHNVCNSVGVRVNVPIDSAQFIVIFPYAYSAILHRVELSPSLSLHCCSTRRMYRVVLSQVEATKYRSRAREVEVYWSTNTQTNLSKWRSIYNNLFSPCVVWHSIRIRSSGRLSIPYYVICQMCQSNLPLEKHGSCTLFCGSRKMSQLKLVN